MLDGPVNNVTNLNVSRFRSLTLVFAELMLNKSAGNFILVHCSLAVELGSLYRIRTAKLG